MHNTGHALRTTIDEDTQKMTKSTTSYYLVFDFFDLENERKNGAKIPPLLPPFPARNLSLIRTPILIEFNQHRPITGRHFQFNQQARPYNPSILPYNRTHSRPQPLHFCIKKSAKNRRKKQVKYGIKSRKKNKTKRKEL